MERRLVTTTRETPARLVPTGDPISIPAGTFVTLTQSLGGAYTVVVDGNMARVAGHDADALGLPKEELTFDPSDQIPCLDHIWHAIRSVYDPEIPVNIGDLGLIYHVELEGTEVDISMTLTAPGCGMGPVLIEELKERVAQAPGVTSVDIELVFDPPWSRDMMSEEAQLELGLF